MSEVVIVEAVRSPVGRRGGGLSTIHPADLLAAVQKAVIERSGIDPAEVGQVVGGCVSQVGEQAFNIARTAWLTAGLPLERGGHHRRHPVRVVAAGHQPGHRARRPAAWSTSAVACGVESMSRVPIGSSGRKDLGLGVPIPKSYFPQYEFTSQFEGAERIADKWGITRDDTDAFGLRSQPSAAKAWAEDRFGTQIVAGRRPRPRRRRQAHRHHPQRQPRRGPAGHHAREAGRAQARRPARRRAHRRLVVADLRRRRRRAAHDRRAGRGPRPAAPGPDRRHLPRRRRPRADAHRPDRRHPAAVRAHRPRRRRHRRRRDQRGLRLGRAGLAEGARLRRRRRSTPTAAPSPSATRSAAPAPSC